MKVLKMMKEFDQWPEAGYVSDTWCGDHSELGMEGDQQEAHGRTSQDVGGLVQEDVNGRRGRVLSGTTTQATLKSSHAKQDRIGGKASKVTRAEQQMTLKGVHNRGGEMKGPTAKFPQQLIITHTTQIFTFKALDRIQLNQHILEVDEPGHIPS
ncbi:uncharacterized protein LOC121274595 isoform X2 [Carcharodon carcharias]|uniref:uncharacterized protein LOC121274595 isoform X2 n=1 Tax=Carcharodon carcharias TaxID=13397 RepID=UPI001B7F6C58|nr:uncharacterized protein LOC121274595 isoform X2 [Carcharodon carcharias]